MKVFWMLAVSAFVVLGGAAVWLGGLNQDEGWYLYAANLVAEGQMPYRDFFFTQGPVMPYVYSFFADFWRNYGLLGARVCNLAIGAMGIVFACALARRMARGAGLVTFFLLATNLYHLYYLAIPKTYALAGLFVMVGFYLLSFVQTTFYKKWAVACAVGAGLCFAFAAGTRISLGAILPVVGVALLLGGAAPGSGSRYGVGRAVAFVVGGLLGLGLVYGPVLLDDGARAGLVAAQQYHAARGGSDIVWTVGSLSRLVRWYLPVFVVLGLGVAAKIPLGRLPETESPVVGRWLSVVAFLSFLAVFAVQMLAPFPYEDYQVPIMGLLAVVAAVGFARGWGLGSAAGEDAHCSSDCLRQLGFASADMRYGVLLVLGLCFASSFGSPLLERWMTNGQDRFWSLKKAQPELAQLRTVAGKIRELDPNGKMILTQDLYLAIELNRKVPKGLEMGPFAMLSDDAWRTLLSSAHETCPVAALSGYSFAIEPPACTERPVTTQLDYYRLLESTYAPAFREDYFGQNATPLLVLKRKLGSAAGETHRGTGKAGCGTEGTR